MGSSRARTFKGRALIGLVGFGAVAVFAAACGTGTGATSKGAGYGAPAAAPSTDAAAVTLATRQVQLGSILTGPAGRSVYLFEKDAGTTSTCADACAQTWPPLTASTVSAGAGATPSLIGTTRRSDGALQVTYAGHPLYRFSGDDAAGQTNGEGLKAFGAGWYVLTPQGTKIDDD